MSSSRQAAVAWLAIPVVLVVAVVGAALWWPPTDGRASQIAAASSLVIPIAAITAYCFVVGLAILVWIPRAQRSSLGLATGIGVAVSSVAVLISYQLAGNATAVVWPILIVAALSIGAATVVSVRHAAPGSPSLVVRVGRNARAIAVRSGDLVAITVASAVMFTVARFGAAAWTTLINDFHRYAGSAMSWLSDSGVGPDFAAKFPGSYGTAMLNRAASEKPGTTALLVTATQVTGLQPYELLAPLSILLLATLLSALIVVLRRGFHLGLPMALACAIPPTLSLVPLSRVFDAQLGQLAAAALLATVLAVISVETPAPQRWMHILRGAVAGIGIAAAIASNATLVLSFAPVVAILAAWIMARKGWNRPAVLAYISAGLGVMIAASLPFATGYAHSLSSQTDGGPGVDIPFPFPLALLGLQPSLEASDAVPFAWGVAAAAAVIGLALRRPKSVDARFAVATIALSAAMVVGLGVAFGFDNYSVHKWLGLWIAVAAPILVGASVAKLVGHLAVVAGTVLAATAAVALLVASNAGYQVGNVVSPEVFALSDDSTLAGIDNLNVDLGDLYLNSLAPLAMPSRTVTVVDTTYAAADSPRGDDFLISAASRGERDWRSVRPLGGGLSLASVDLGLDDGTHDFSTTGAAARNNLFGSWYKPETIGTWSAPGAGLIVFDVGGDLSSGDLSVALDGVLFGAPGSPATMRVTVYGELSTTVTSTSEAPTTVELIVPRSEIAEHDGRVVIGIASTHGVVPVDVYPAGSTADRRQLVFGLRSMTLAGIE